MMPITLDIPVYKGGYRMDADALQMQMIEIRDSIMMAVLSEEERHEIHVREYAAERWNFDQLQEAQLVRVQELLPERLGNRDRHGWTVKELLAEFERLGAEMGREYGIV